MSAFWTREQLKRIGEAEELQIASRRPDGTLRPFVPIWVVPAAGQVYVRTWHRRTTGQMVSDPAAAATLRLIPS